MCQEVYKIGNENSLSAIVREALISAGITPSQFANELDEQGIYCGRSTRKMLSPNEQGNPTPLLILKAGEKTQDYHLYIQALQQDPVGAKVLNKKVEKKPIEQPAITLHLMSTTVNQISTQILGIVADGIIDDSEQQEYEKCMEFVDNLIKACYELKCSYVANYGRR